MVYYGWIVVASSFAITLMYGVFYSFGVFLTPILSEFGWSNVEATSTLSIHAAVYSVSAVLMGRLTDVYGPRIPVWLGGFMLGLGLVMSSSVSTLYHLYVFYGLIASAGVGSLFIPTYSTVVKWFTRRRGAALGIVTAGTGFGGLLIPPLCERLIVVYGWRGAFLVLGVLIWVVMFICGLAMRSPSREDNSSTRLLISRFPLGFSAFRMKVFWLLSMVYALFFASTYIPLTYIAPFAISIGISSFMAASALSFFGASSIAGRLLVGYLSDRFSRLYVLMVCFMFLVVSMVLLMVARSVFMLYLSATIFGFSFGGCIPQMPAVVREFFGSTSIGIVYGVFEGVAFGVGGAFGPVLGGYIKDVTGSYQLAFLASSLLSLIAVVVLVVIHRLQ